MNGALNQQVCVSKSESPTKKIRVEEYNDFGALASIQQEWDEFVESVGCEIFLTYDWCRIWWKYYGKNRKLRIFIFRCNNEIAGIIPLFLERIWLGPVYTRAVKIVGSDFTLAQFNLPIHSMYIKGVVQKLFELLSEDKWEIIHIGPIAGLYKHYDSMKEAFAKSFSQSYCVAAKKNGVQTYFQVPDTWEEYLAGLKKKERQLIRSAYRKIYEKDLILNSRIASVANLALKFEAFVQTHQSNWQQAGKAGHFGDWPNSFEFHKETAIVQLMHKRLRLLEVLLTGDCFAYQYSYKFGNRYFELLTGRLLPESLAHIDLGRILFAEQMKRTVKENAHSIDSMRGEYEYKLRLGGKLFPIRSIYIFPKKLSVSLRVSLFRALASFLNLCYYRIWYCRIAPKLPLRRRPLWRIWIRTSGFS
ncbi:MAG: GNAT family N-acetyltransferase [Planctomycetota bacterium]|jgi:CelD/BcsL family acetyltransferase involved in cellulose biosynthesis